MNRAGLPAAPILLVEDDLDDREAIAELLEREGYLVDRAVDGADALTLAALRTPKLVVVDIAMPRMDGFEVARRLREDVGLTKVPILGVTGQTPPRGLGAFTEIFFKPLRGTQFLAFVREVLREASAQTG